MKILKKHVYEPIFFSLMIIAIFLINPIEIM